MKYCPYCGASIVDGAASFCAECGKAMPVAVDPRPSRGAVRPATARPPSAPIRKPPAKPAPPKYRKPPAAHGKPIPKRHANRRPVPPRPPRPESRDDSYDGYYNDVKPIDNGHIRDRTDPELIKRIIMVAAGAVLLVILSVILMYLL